MPQCVCSGAWPCRRWVWPIWFLDLSDLGGSAPVVCRRISSRSVLRWYSRMILDLLPSLDAGATEGNFLRSLWCSVTPFLESGSLLTFCLCRLIVDFWIAGIRVDFFSWNRLGLLESRSGEWDFCTWEFLGWKLVSSGLGSDCWIDFFSGNQGSGWTWMSRLNCHCSGK